MIYDRVVVRVRTQYKDGTWSASTTPAEGEYLWATEDFTPMTFTHWARQLHRVQVGGRTLLAVAIAPLTSKTKWARYARAFEEYAP